MLVMMSNETPGRYKRWMEQVNEIVQGRPHLIKYMIDVLSYRCMSERFYKTLDRVFKLKGKYRKTHPRDARAYRAEMLRRKGYFVYPPELFEDMEHLGESDAAAEGVLAEVARSVRNSTLYSDAPNSLKYALDEMCNGGHKLGKNRTERREMVMKMIRAVSAVPAGAIRGAMDSLIVLYEQTSGQKVGGGYTPPKLAELVIRLGALGMRGEDEYDDEEGDEDDDDENKTDERKEFDIYDPACGSGSLLTTAVRMLKPPGKIRISAQETDSTLCSICCNSLLMAGLPPSRMHLENANVITDPRFPASREFNLIVCHPPHRQRWPRDWAPWLTLMDERFYHCCPPFNKSDGGYMMDAVKHLAPGGRAIFICRREIMGNGGNDHYVREYLLLRGYVDAVIQLPEGLLPDTPESVLLLILRREAEGEKPQGDVLFIDVSHHDKLSPELCDYIEDVYKARTVTPGISWRPSKGLLRMFKINFLPESHLDHL